MDCKLNINRYIQKNCQISVLFTLTKKSDKTNVYGFLIALCAIVYYRVVNSLKHGVTVADFIVYPFTFISLFICTFKICNFVKEESLLVTVPLCLQYTKTSRNGSRRVNYIPWCDIKDFVIIEVITGQKVLFYLALLLNDGNTKSNQHLILFKETMPRLHHLEIIYKEAQSLIDKYR